MALDQKDTATDVPEFTPSYVLTSEGYAYHPLLVLASKTASLPQCQERLILLWSTAWLKYPSLSLKIQQLSCEGGQIMHAPSEGPEDMPEAAAECAQHSPP